jgi:hypothetical protein
MTTRTTTMTEVSAATIRSALKFLYRSTPVGPDEDAELFRLIKRLEAALNKK